MMGYNVEIWKKRKYLHKYLSWKQTVMFQKTKTSLKRLSMSLNTRSCKSKCMSQLINLYLNLTRLGLFAYINISPWPDVEVQKLASAEDFFFKMYSGQLHRVTAARHTWLACEKMQVSFKIVLKRLLFYIGEGRILWWLCVCVCMHVDWVGVDGSRGRRAAGYEMCLRKTGRKR